MKSNSLIVILGLILGGIILLSASTYTVSETEQVIITRFGAPVGKPVTEAGLHFKTPFIDTANSLDKRTLEWDGEANQLPTKDKLFIYVDTYARWRISDPLLFLQRLRTETVAQTRLDDILDGITRDEIANHELLEIVRSVNRQTIKDETLDKMGDVLGSLEPITVGRAKIADEIHQQAAAQLKDLGIELLDIRFKRINYNEQVQDKIYERMISERDQIAEKFRSEGGGEAARVLGDKELALKQIQSEAYLQVQQIEGQADAQASDIYANAYNQSSQASEFFTFLKTMDTYSKVLGKDTTVLLGTKSDFFKYLEPTTVQPAWVASAHGLLATPASAPASTSAPTTAH